MHITKVRKLRIDEDTGSFKIAGSDGFGKEKTVYIDIENPELFLNVIKSAFQKTGKNFQVIPD